MAMTERLTLLIEASSKGAANEFDSLSKKAGETNQQVGLLGKAAGSLKGAMMNLGAAALGAGVVATLGKMVETYVEGAKAANAMGQSMNATTGEASKFNAMMSSVGLDMNDLIEIQAEFAQKIKGTEDNIGGLGVAVAKNADGTINWVNTLTDTLEALQGVGDATERNKLLFGLFGEEGGKQMAKLLTSGRSIKEIYESMPELFGDSDVAAALEYEQAMGELKTTGQEFAVTFGRMVVPILTDAIGLFSSLAGVVGTISPQMLTAGAAVAGMMLKFGDLGLAKTGVQLFASDVRSAFSDLRSGEVGAAGTFSKIRDSAKYAGQGVMSAFGGPVGLTIAGLTLALGKLAEAHANTEEKVKTHAVALNDLEDAGNLTTKSVEKRAQMIEDEMGMWDKLALGWDGVTAMFGGDFSQLTMTAEEQIAQKLNKTREEMTALEQQQMSSTTTQATFNEMVASGTASAEEYAGAAREAADAQMEKSNSDSLAKKVLEGLVNETQNAVLAQLDLNMAIIDGAIGYQDLTNKGGELNKVMADGEATERDRLVVQKEVLGQIGTNAAANISAWEKAEAAQGRYYSEGDIKIKQNQEALRIMRELLVTQPEGTPLHDWLTGQIASVEATNPNIDVAVEPVGADEAGQTAKGGAQAGATGAGPVQIDISGSKGGPPVIAYITSIATRKYPTATIPIDSTNGPAVISYIGSIGSRRYGEATIPVATTGGPAAIAYINSIAGHHGTAYIGIATTGGPDAINYINSIVHRNYGTINLPITYRATNSPTAPVPVGAGVLGAPGAPTVRAPSASTTGGSVSNVTINLPPGTPTSRTLQELRRYRRGGGDMSGLIDSIVAVR